MKIRKIFVSMLAIATLASCSQDDNDVAIPEQTGDNAYLSVAINAAAPGTYAPTGPTNTNGTSEESKTDGGMIVVGFASDQSTVKGVYSFTKDASELGTIGGQGTAASAGDAFKVDKDIKYIFVILNPTDKIKGQVNTSMTSYAAMNQVITETVGNLTKSNEFLMTSAGEYSTTDTYKQEYGLIEVTPSLAATESASDIAAAKADAKTNAKTIKVDRVTAKVSLATFAGTVENGTAQIDGFRANTTNTKYLPYAKLVNYTIDGTTAGSAKYREDANFGAIASPAFMTEFNWLDNKDNVASATTPIDWLTPAKSEYVLENTMAASPVQNYNNTTKLTIKAQFAPTGVTLGDSWFRVGGIIKTFAELDADYSALVAGTIVDATYKTGLESFLDAVLGTTRTVGWTDEGKTTVVTLADLDAVANAGYLAAKATPKYIVEYFQKSVCYYDVNLMHDYNVQAKLLGRWGVVRNNFYTLNITKITKAGKPYIPDPTDPDITDPENPDPTDPDPDDETSAYLSVIIEVNPWTAWTQETEL